MKHLLLPILLSLSTIALYPFGAVAADSTSALAPALESFAAYDYGQPKKVLHDTRRAAFRGTDDEKVRSDHEQRLLEFIQSDAKPAARREACMWLSDLGSEKSQPVLKKLADTDDMADVAQIALDVLAATRKDSSPAAGSHQLAAFKASVMEGDRKAEILTNAIQSNDVPQARLAFDLFAHGTATEEVSAWLGDHILELTPDRQLLALNTLMAIEAPQTAEVIQALSRDGRGAARLEAIAQLGLLGRAEDIEFLKGLLTGGDEEVANATASALAMMPETVAGAFLTEQLKSSDGALQLRAIEIATVRGQDFATEPLFSIASQDGHANQQLAIRALGKVAAPGSYEAVLDAFLKAEGSAVQKDWQGALWDLSRRQSDSDQTLAMVEAAAKNSSEKTKATLTALAGKLNGLKPAQSLEQVRDPVKSPAKSASSPKPRAKGSPVILLPESYREVVPKRFKVAAYLDCGPQSKVEGGGIAIERLNGKSYNSDPGVHPALSVDFADASLDYAVTGLDPKGDYLIGFTWWDSTFNGRRQSIHLNGQEVLPDTRCIAFEEPAENKDKTLRFRGKPTPVRIQFALLPEHIADGKLDVGIRKVGPSNTVNSELWIMKRAKPAAEKQILLVSGQDYPGHHWRKTGPVMEELIIQDERMEVTICETPYAVGLKHLDHYDAVFVHFKNYESDLPSTEHMQKNLENYVKSGGGMCLSHFACGAMQEWPEFVNLSGRVWNGEGHDKRGPFTVKIVDHEHPVTKGLHDFETDDELYFCLMGDPKIHLLCNAFSKKKQADHPQAFVFHPGKGRVFLRTLGHDVKAYDAEGARQLYRQGTAWAAGLGE